MFISQLLFNFTKQAPCTRLFAYVLVSVCVEASPKSFESTNGTFTHNQYTFSAMSRRYSFLGSNIGLKLSCAQTLGEILVSKNKLLFVLQSLVLVIKFKIMISRIFANWIFGPNKRYITVKQCHELHKNRQKSLWIKKMIDLFPSE